VPSFDEAWLAVAKNRDGETVSTELRSLLREVYSQLVLRPGDLAGLKRSLQHLLEYLSNEGRTNANCWAVDLFFEECEGWERHWGELDLPEEFDDVLAKMGEALHDTVKDPSVAHNFRCSPEQLLDEVGLLNVSQPTSKDRPA
jgi:hypothetical protein